MLASEISLGCSLELKPIDPPLSSLGIYTETSTTIASRPLPSWPGEFRNCRGDLWGRLPQPRPVPKIKAPFTPAALQHFLAPRRAPRDFDHDRVAAAAELAGRV